MATKARPADAPDAAKWMPPASRPSPSTWVPKVPTPWTRAGLAAAVSLGERVTVLMPDGSITTDREATFAADLGRAVAACVGSGPWKAIR